MRVFLSWKGPASQLVADEMRTWLKKIVQAVDPYLSSEDTEKGSRWPNEIALELAASNYGVICLTPENLEAPWINFEAGALSKTLDASRVSPIVIGMTKGDVTWPLAQFQLTSPDKEDMLRLMRSINSACGEGSIPDQLLSELFDNFWPRLAEVFDRAAKLLEEVPSEESRPRAPDEMLEELLELARGQERRLARIERQQQMVDAAFSLGSMASGGAILPRRTARSAILADAHRLLEAEGIEGKLAGEGSETVLLDVSHAPSAALISELRQLEARYGITVQLRHVGPPAG